MQDTKYWRTTPANSMRDCSDNVLKASVVKKCKGPGVDVTLRNRKNSLCRGYDQYRSPEGITAFQKKAFHGGSSLRTD